MKFKNLFINFILMSFSSFAFAVTDPCSTLADLTSKSNPNDFVGFGAGTTQKDADNNAQIDLASRIRQNLTSTSTVTENNENSNLNSTSKSVVSESLIGAKILKRCSTSDSFSTVVTLEHKIFVSSLESRLVFNVSKGQKLIEEINSAKNDEVVGQNIDIAKKFIDDYQSTFESDLQLCKIFNGCGAIKNESVFTDLNNLVIANGDKNQYILITNQTDVSDVFREDIISLLENDGLKIMDVIDNKSPSARKIIAKCIANLGPKIPNSADRIIETKCTADIFIGKQKKGRKVFSCKAVVDNDMDREDAVGSCSGRLKPDEGP